MWTETQLAYMAGIVDGEGSIVVVPTTSVSKGKKYPRFSIRIHAYNNDLGLMLWLKSTFCGSWSPVKRRRTKWTQSYQWYVSHTAAAVIAQAILPYLVIKRRQAEILIQFNATMNRRGTRGTPSNVLEIRKGLHAECKKLNRHGVGNALEAV